MYRDVNLEKYIQASNSLYNFGCYDKERYKLEGITYVL